MTTLPWPPLFRRGREKAVRAPYSMASAQASRQRKCTCRGLAQHPTSRLATSSTPPNNKIDFLYISFYCAYVDYPFAPSKMEQFENMHRTLQSEGPSMSLNASRGPEAADPGLVRTNSVAVSPGGDETPAQRVLQSFFREHGVRGDVCQGIY
jgi:hypothetical protein